MSKATTQAQVQKEIATWQEGYAQLLNDQMTKRETLENNFENAKCVYVYKMSIATQLPNTEIAIILGLGNGDYVKKMITRGALVEHGMDGAKGAQLVKATGNGITVVSIDEIVSGDGTKAEKKIALEELGLVTKEIAQRETEGGKSKLTRDERTKQDLVKLHLIVKHAIDGDTKAVAIWEALMDATNHEAFRGLTK